MSPRVLVLRSPGVNCDAETAYAFERAGAAADVIHLNRWIEQPQLARQYQILALPGGFSYGDDLSAGRIAGNQLRHHLADALGEFRDAGKLILGICNGFQTLIKSGLLDSDDDAGAGATLAWNAGGRYQDRWVRLRATSPQCMFLQGVEELELPIAHAEGQFRARDEAKLDELEEAGQLALRYVDGPGASVPFNPNGAQRDVAGLCDRSGRVFGLMPHPERCIDPTHHPQWPRRQPASEGAGMAIFRNAVKNV